MKANNRFSIAFIVKLNKKDKTKGLLYARVAVNGEYTEPKRADRPRIPGCSQGRSSGKDSRSQSFKQAYR
jgi:hypothetical protein